MAENFSKRKPSKGNAALLANAKLRLRAFVIMPILKSDTPEHAHFKSILKDYIDPAIGDNFDVIRSDDISRSGSFLADIIRYIHDSDLVVADITGGNPNVLYELGIRHALAKFGTILLRDEGVTPQLPSDLQTYRCISYRNDARGLMDLKNSLRKSAQDVIDSFEDDDVSDNPVYDVLREFTPSKLYATDTVKESQYSQSMGDKSLSPLDRLRIAKDEAKDGLQPPKLIENAEDAVRSGDTYAFLQNLELFVTLEMLKPTEREYIDMYYLARRLDVRAATEAIWELAYAAFPESRRLNEVRITSLAHSKIPSDWDKAIEFAESLLGVNLHDPKVAVDDLLKDENNHILGILLDALHKKGQHEVGLNITKALVDKHPNNTSSWRNYARAMEGVSNSTNLSEIIAAYERSILCTDVDDTSASWFASTFEDERRRDAIELRVLACLLDLDEAKQYMALATDISLVMQPRNHFIFRRNGDILPDIFNESTVAKLLVFARECESFGAEERNISLRVMDTLGLEARDLEAVEDEARDTSRKFRGEFMMTLYDTIRSNLTEAAGSGVK